MTTSKMNPYKEDHPLRSGITLLEASAGTGKTYSVTFLYLRLLLEQGLQPSEIVVVTFTRAAAAELRERIHKRIADAESTLIKLLDSNTDLAALRQDEEVVKLEGILARATVDDPLATLQAARALLDTSTISTIHKFAGRLSDEFAMVTGTPSQATLVESLDEQIEDALRDLEHQLAEEFPIECEAIADPNVGFSSTVRRLAKNILDDPDVSLLPEFLLTETATPTVMDYQAQSGGDASAETETPDVQFAQLMKTVATRLLAGEGAALGEWFAELRASKAKPKPISGTRIRKGSPEGRLEILLDLCTRIATMQDLNAIRDESLRVFKQAGGAADLLKYFSFEYLAEVHQSFSGDCLAKPGVHDIPLFAQDADRLIVLSRLLEVDVFNRIWMQRVAQKVAAMVEERTALAGVRSHAHIISDVVEALDSSHKQALINAVASRYKAALIDEFQDTDLRQWKIFNELFGKQDAITYLIGDPKQAIYGFRGANVAVYERVRDGLPEDRVMTLGTNYRSDFAYNEAVNGLFSATDRIGSSDLTGTYAEDFVARYQPVGSPDRAPSPTQRMELSALALRPEHEDARHCVTHGPSGSALVIRDTQATKISDYRSWSATNIAKEIVQLLSEESTSKLFVDDSWRAIRPRDCAVIVRGKTDAAIMVDALRRAGVPAVARDHQSVALAPAADGILHWLTAIDAPTRAANIRAFLCSPLVGMQIDELDEMPEQTLSDWTSFFDELKRRWSARGLHASLRATLHRSVAAPTQSGGPNIEPATLSRNESTGPAEARSESRSEDSADDVMSRLLRRDAGSRVAGDVMHLAEILNVAQRAERLSPRGLGDWFSRRRQEEEENGGKDERFKRRVESDAEAVQVVTAHSSKGLEYNLVWLVGLTEGKHNASFLIHPESSTTRFVVDKATYKLLQDSSERELADAESLEDAQNVEATRRASPEFQAAERYIYKMLDVSFPSLKSELLTLPRRADNQETFSLHAAIHASEHAAVNEDLRLLYVALTRARMRSVVYLGPVLKAAADLLLTTRPAVPKQDAEPYEETPFGLHRLARASAWPAASLSIEQWFIDRDDPTLPRHKSRDYEELRATMKALAAPAVTSTRHNMQSYSSLTKLLPDHFNNFNESEEPVIAEDALEGSFLNQTGNDDVGREDTGNDEGSGVELPDTLAPLDEAPLPLATFSSGKEAGTALHVVFEDVDFVGAAEDPIAPAFEEQLTKHVTTGLVSNGLDPSRDGDALQRGVLAVLRTPIGGELGTTRLADIPRSDRIDELMFFMPMGDGQQGTTTNALFRVLSQRKGDPAIDERWFADLADDIVGQRSAYGDPPKVDLNGLLTGFIDLVFRKEVDGVTRYFIADYKSNRIVARGEPIVASAFTPEAVKHEMAIHHYYLQYHIYLVALHRWLGARLPDYDYDTHVGGAYYLFVRGMSGADTPIKDGYARGVFFDRPSRELIEALDLAFRRSEPAESPSAVSASVSRGTP